MPLTWSSKVLLWWHKPFRSLTCTMILLQSIKFSEWSKKKHFRVVSKNLFFFVEVQNLSAKILKKIELLSVPLVVNTNATQKWWQSDSFHWHRATQLTSFVWFEDHVSLTPFFFHFLKKPKEAFWSFLVSIIGYV